MPLDILFLGGTSIDLIQDKSNRKKQHRSVGGGITNTAVIASKLGLKTAMLSRIGKDAFGNFAIKRLDSYGVNTNGIIQDPNIRTPLAIANIDKYGNSKYTFHKNPPKDSIVPLERVPRVLLETCKIFHFGSSFSYQTDSSEEALRYVRFLKKRGIFISFDPNLRPYVIRDKKGVKNRVSRLLKWVNLAKLSKVDLRFLTGQKGLKNGLKMLNKQFKCKVVVTLGSKGSAYLDPNGKLIKIPALKVKVADTIGAGDAFTAGILYKLIKTGGKHVFANIKPYLVFASTVSAITCTKPGANQGLKDIKQVNSFNLKYFDFPPLA